MNELISRLKKMHEEWQKASQLAMAATQDEQKAKCIAADKFSVQIMEMIPEIVAAKLAGAGPEPCEHGKVKHCPWPRSVIEGKRTCSFCRMKYARIEVEEEMDRP